MKMYLDDIRPCPVGWDLVKTVEQAKEFCMSNHVTDMSLDHDLGACRDCMRTFIGDMLNGFDSFDDLSYEELSNLWLMKSQMKAMPHCDHFGSGYNFICWLEEHPQYWPERIQVHSANPVGRARMQQVIDKYYDQI